MNTGGLLGSTHDLKLELNNDSSNTRYDRFDIEAHSHRKEYPYLHEGRTCTTPSSSSLDRIFLFAADPPHGDASSFSVHFSRYHDSTRWRTNMRRASVDRRVAIMAPMALTTNVIQFNLSNRLLSKLH